MPYLILSSNCLSGVHGFVCSWFTLSVPAMWCVCIAWACSRARVVEGGGLEMVVEGGGWWDGDGGGGGDIIGPP